MFDLHFAHEQRNVQECCCTVPYVNTIVIFSTKIGLRVWISLLQTVLWTKKIISLEWMEWFHRKTVARTGILCSELGRDEWYKQWNFPVLLFRSFTTAHCFMICWCHWRSETHKPTYKHEKTPLNRHSCLNLCSGSLSDMYWVCTSSLHCNAGLFLYIPNSMVLSNEKTGLINYWGF